MLKYILILAAPTEDCHAKNSVVPSGISAIKYLETVSISLRFAASAHAAYSICLLLLNTGISFIEPCFLITVNT